MKSFKIVVKTTDGWTRIHITNNVEDILRKYEAGAKVKIEIVDRENFYLG